MLERFLLLTVVIVAPVFLSMESQILEPFREKNSLEVAVKSKPSSRGEKDLNLLSHRLIKYDEEHGFVSPELASMARGNTLFFLKTVDEQCDKSTANHLISCANDILGKQFYYKPSDTVAEAWANRYSDCDLNSYLLMDAAHKYGFQADIVYAPGHALISYRDKQGNIHFQETTKNNNKGEVADLASPFYIKAMPGFYYQSFDAVYAEKLYPVLTAGRLVRNDGKQLSSVMMSHWPDNPLVQDIYFHFRKPLTEDDVEKLESLLVIDISSTTKRLLLAEYYIQNAESDKATPYLDQVSDEKCSNTCLKLKSKYSIQPQLALWIQQYFGHEIDNVMIINFLNDLMKLYIIIFICFLLFSARSEIKSYLTRILAPAAYFASPLLRRHQESAASKKPDTPL